MLDRIVFTIGGAFTPAASAFLDEVPNQKPEKPFASSTLRKLVESLLRLRR